MKKYDLIAIGGGSGGISAVERAAELGGKCALIEDRHWGGTCVNIGCVPKKLFWKASKQYHELDYLRGFGIEIGQKRFSWERFCAMRNDVVEGIRAWYGNVFRDRVDLFSGVGVIRGEHTVEVGGELLWGEKILIATGSLPVVPDIVGAGHGLISDDLFTLKRRPQSMAIVGAGYIALEFAYILSGLGVDVSLIIRKEKPLSGAEPEIQDLLLESLERCGVRVFRQSTVSHVTPEGNYKRVALNSGSTTSVVTAEQLMWCVGRRSNLSCLQGNAAGVAVSGGHVVTDKYSRTSVPSILAIGDATDRPKLTPVAIQEGRRLIMRLYEGQKEEHLDTRFVPTVVFTRPPIASIGIGEREAKRHYDGDVAVYSNRFSPLENEMIGKPDAFFIKMICRKESQTILGIHMMGESADEMLQGFAVALNMGATKMDFDKTIAIHPTLAEELVTLKPIL